MSEYGTRVSDLTTVVLDQRHASSCRISLEQLALSVVPRTALVLAVLDTIANLGDTEDEHPELHFDWRTFRLTVEPETISLTGWGKDVLVVRGSISSGQRNV